MHRSKLFTAALAVSGLSALGDIATLPLGNGETPPVEVAVVGAVLGLITLVALLPAWRGSRAGVTAIIVSRLLSAMTALPAFFVDGVPAPAVAAAAIGIVVTVATVAVLAPRLRRPAVAAA